MSGANDINIQGGNSIIQDRDLPYIGFDINERSTTAEGSVYEAWLNSRDANVDWGHDWQFSEKVIDAIYEDDELEESFITAMRKVDRFLDDGGYQNRQLRAELSINPEFPNSSEYYIHVTLPIGDVEEWVSIEDRIQDIVANSEVGDIQLYVLVDRATN